MNIGKLIKRNGFSLIHGSDELSINDLTDDSRRVRAGYGFVARGSGDVLRGYINDAVERGAAAIFSESGKAQTKELIDHYMGNAALLREACTKAGLTVYGGVNAPYVWVGCPDGIDSWRMFDKMLEEANVVVTPGAGFGAAGEGYFRISAFNSRENVEEVCRRIAVHLS